MSTYTPAPEVRLVAEPIIRRHHPRLITVPIEYVFRDPPAKRSGRIIWAQVRGITGLAAYLAGDIADLEGQLHEGNRAVLEVASEIWQRLNPQHRDALVDHELAHLYWNPERDTPDFRSHDLEEFAEVIARHGIWSQAAANFVKGAGLQLSLDAALNLEPSLEIGGPA